MLALVGTFSVITNLCVDLRLKLYIILHLAIPLLGVSRGQRVIVCYNDISAAAVAAPPTTYDGYPLITLLCRPSCSPHHRRRDSINVIISDTA